MIKVLLVEDDKLVRQGLISAMPWQEFGLEIVGEAKNGQKALEFLEQHPVDLLITDLAMPVMSGVELMGIVRQKHPHIFHVVLTLHQDFEYIQEALRQGAIDYIAKVQLEEEGYHQILERICKRIEEERKKDVRRGRGTSTIQGPIRTSVVYALISATGGFIENAVPSYFSEFRMKLMIPGGLLLLPDDTNHISEIERQMKVFSQMEEATSYRLLVINGVDQAEVQNVCRWLLNYLENFYFYDHDDEQWSITLTYRLDMDSEIDSMQAHDITKEYWLPLGWMNAQEQYEALLTELRQLRLPKARLMKLLYMLGTDWNHMYSSVTSQHVELPEVINDWQEVENWVQQVRVKLHQAFGKPQFSPEVQDSIARAVRLIHERLGEAIQANEIAKQVHMSRSYFSQCFKDIVGMTFHDYVRHVRMEKAKEYLQFTDKTIQWIAEHTGYADEKYFSSVFRKQTGMLPTEYRQHVAVK